MQVARGFSPAAKTARDQKSAFVACGIGNKFWWK
jgi:hypothetical protein